jgi:hypothetical protein
MGFQWAVKTFGGRIKGRPVCSVRRSAFSFFVVCIVYRLVSCWVDGGPVDGVYLKIYHDGRPVAA